MSRIDYSQSVKSSLWRKASGAGLTRRKFLTLLAAGGAAAVLAGCTPRTSTSQASSIPLTTTTIATTAATSPPTTSAARLDDKPTPSQFFNPIGGGNVEMKFENMANRTLQIPNSYFFVRDHTGYVNIDPATWRLNIQGDGVANPLSLSYDDLLKLPTTTITRYVECAGNGRSFYDTLMQKQATGGQWHLGGYGVADWTGVKLSVILNQAGIKSSAVDVMPTGLDSTAVERPMPVAKAMSDDTILAYMMNGDILPVDHGFPARIIAPGWVGVASVKWVGKITVSQSPIYVEKNTTSYVLIGPDYQAQSPAQGPILNSQVMKSACCLPWPATLPAGQQKIQGYAWSPVGKITNVDVSLDGGKTFKPATLIGPNIEKAGTRWEFNFNATPGDMTLTPRATDDQGNAQYDISQQKWNQLGYVFGAMVPHPVKVV